MRYYSDPEAYISYDEVNAAVEEAFAEHCRGIVQMPPKVYVTFPSGDFRTMPAYIPGLDIAGVKVVNVHPENPSRGLPTVMAVTVIIDIDTEPTEFTGLTLVELTVSEDREDLFGDEETTIISFTLRQFVSLRDEETEEYELDELMRDLPPEAGTRP